MTTSIFQQKIVLQKPSIFYDLENENISIMLSFLWALQWYYLKSK